MSDASITLDEAVDLARTGDVWLFRGHTAADRAIQVATNSPINHVGMSVAIEDLPPLMWHAELGRSLTDVWTGDRHRGVQLNDLREAVIVWATRYGQRAWLRQLDPAVTGEMEDAVLRTIARLDGTPFPSTARLASEWALARVPARNRPGRGADPETAYCAQVLAVTYQAMGLLPSGRRPDWYDPGRFWSGDHLGLSDGFRLGGEIAVHIPGRLPFRDGPARRRTAIRGQDEGSTRLRQPGLPAITRGRFTAGQIRVSRQLTDGADTAWLASRVTWCTSLPIVTVAWATGCPWLIACASGRGVTVTVTGVPGQAVTATPVAATAAGPAVHALDTLPMTAPGLTTWARSRSPPTLARRVSEAEITPSSSLGWAGVACTPSTTPTIVTWLPATFRIAAKARHPPASELEPVLTPTIPSWPRPALTL